MKDILFEEWLLAVTVDNFNKRKKDFEPSNKTGISSNIVAYLKERGSLKANVNSVFNVFTEASAGIFKSLSPTKSKVKIYYFLEYNDCNSVKQFNEQHPIIDDKKVATLYHFLSVDRNELLGNKKEGSIIDAIKQLVNTSNAATVKSYPHKLNAVYKNTRCIEDLPDELSLIDIGFLAENIVTINGTGGIGKSTLANIYMHKNIGNYSHVAWLSLKDYDQLYDPDNSRALFESTRTLNLLFNIPSSLPADEQFILCLAALGELKGKKLLVIDNAGPALAEYWDYLNCEGLHVLITSRYNFPDSRGDARIELTGFSNYVSIRIFNLFRYGMEETRSEADSATLQKIVDSCQRHPLLIQLLANLAHQNNFSTSQLHELLNREGMLLGKGIHISIGKNITDLQSYIFKLFPLFGIKEPMLQLMRFFALMPQLLIPRNHLLQLNWETSDIRKTILETYTFGWITENKTSEEHIAYSMHSIVKEVINQKYKPTYENSAYIIFGFLKGMQELIGQEDTLVNKAQLVEYAEAIFNATRATLTMPDVEYVMFVNTIANRYGKDIKNFEKAFEYSDVALEMAEKIYETTPTQKVIKYLSTIFKNRAMYARGIADTTAKEATYLSIPTIQQYEFALSLIKESNHYADLLEGNNKYETAIENLTEYEKICGRIYEQGQMSDEERELRFAELMLVNETIAKKNTDLYEDNFSQFSNPESINGVACYVIAYTKWGRYLMHDNRLNEAFELFRKVGLKLRRYIEQLIKLAILNPDLPSFKYKEVVSLRQLDAALECFVTDHCMFSKKIMKANTEASDNLEFLIDQFFLFIRKNLLDAFERNADQYQTLLERYKLSTINFIDSVLPFCRQVYKGHILITKLEAFRILLVRGLN